MDISQVNRQSTLFLLFSADNHQAMVPGGTSNEVTQLNIESLWSGGPFADPVRLVQIKLYVWLLSLGQSYNGGNKQSNEQLSTAEAMRNIRQIIFQSSIGEIDSMNSFLLVTDIANVYLFAL